MERLRLTYPVPYAAQVASLDLAARIFDGSLPPEQDPGWAESGASSPEEYAYWTLRACGVVCVKMCVEALGGPQRTMVEWARRGVSLRGYLVEASENVRVHERGWLHKSLAELCRAEGLFAEARPAALDDFSSYLQADQMVVASVSYEIGTDEPITRRGGHLVVVTGAELEDGHAQAFYVNNPSGRTPERQAGARIPVERFAPGYTGRVIVVGRK